MHPKNLETARNYERRLAGDKDVPTHPDDPDYGYYRIPRQDGSGFSTVWYYYADDGKLVCLIDGKLVSEDVAHSRWTWACERPISEELYEKVRSGEPWPDVNEAVVRSNQAPPDNSLEALQQSIEDLAREAKKMIEAGPAKSKAVADQAADVSNRLNALGTKADKAREAEKRPHLEASGDVDDKWRPVITLATIYKRLKEAVLEPFLKAEKLKRDRAEAEARRQAEETRRAALAAEAEAVLLLSRATEEADRAGDAAAVARAAEQAQRVAEESRAAAEAAERNADAIANTSITAGTRGRSVGLRSKTEVTVEDLEANFNFLKEHHDARAELTEVCTKWSKKLVGAGITVPGVKSSKDSKAA